MNNKKLLSMLLLGICIGFTGSSFSMLRDRKTFEQEYTEKEFDGTIVEKNLTNGDQEPIKRIKKQSDFNDDKRLYASLIGGCKKEDLDIVKFWIEKGVDVDEIDNNGDTPLIIACKKGNLDIANLLIKNEADIDKVNKSGNTPLIVACKEGNLDIINLLIKNKADVNYINNGYMPFEFMDFLTTSDTDGSDSTEIGNTPLIVACKKGYIKIAELLIRNGASVNKVCEVFASLITVCEQENINTLIGWLIKEGVDVNKINDEGETPLTFACKKGNLNIAESLIKNKANINKTNREGKTPLIVACEKENLDIVNLLIKNEADVNKNSEDDEYTPLIMACEKENIDLVESWTENEVDIYKVNKGGDTPLIIACKKGNLDIVNLLIKNKANINKTNREGKTPLIVACEKENINLVALLVRYESVIDKESDDGEFTPLVMACEKGNIDLVDLLIRLGADVNKRPDNSSYPPLIMACEKENLDLVKLLVKNKASMNTFNDDNNTALTFTCEKGNFEIVKFMIEFLIEKGINLNEDDSYSSELLIRASENNQLKIVRFLIEKGVDVNKDESNGGCLPLIVSALYGHFDIVKLLIEKGADINKRDRGGYTFLKAAAFGGRSIDIVQLLIRMRIRGIKEIKDMIDKCESKEFLLEKIYTNKLNVLNTLMNYFNEYLQGSFYCLNYQENVIDYSLKNNLNIFKEILRSLFEKTKSILNCEQIITDQYDKKHSFYPLNIIIRTLQSSDLAEIEDISLKKVLVKNIKEIIDLLMKNGSKANYIDIKGRTPVFYTCYTNEMERDEVTSGIYYDCLTKYLIEKYKVKVNLKDKRGDSPLYLAIACANRFSLEVLLQAGAKKIDLNRSKDTFVQALKRREENGLFNYFLQKKKLKDAFELIKDRALKREKPILKEDEKFKGEEKDPCILCAYEFDEKDRRKTFLLCGHAYCLKCVEKMFMSKEKLLCPMCKKESKKEGEHENIEFEAKKSSK